ncbi:hypothetical protein [Fulvivirga sediminis]|uniref:HEAT repeat domain-containing protein n=1 Tax=Fulvivirga sediminis TaxID=2803949 RepID=A0A937K160_9BACT|nr:hypothetical protein [Fulvivirga sediminis]MBL3657116.1 hypothetical protein [Fulvivirga sediminis]
MDRTTIYDHIKSIESNEVKLYSFLYDLIYNEESNDVSFLEKLYSSFLLDDRSEIKRIAIYALLFGLKIQKDRYKNFALDNLQDTENDYDLRLTCISGIGQAYRNTREPLILSILSTLYNDSTEDLNIRAECFSSMMRVYGLDSKEMVKKNNCIIVSFEDIEQDNFNDELNNIAVIIEKRV